jgi:hypothetical protein
MYSATHHTLHVQARGVLRLVAWLVSITAGIVQQCPSSSFFFVFFFFLVVGALV